MKIPMVLARNKGGEISEIQKSIPFWIWHSMMYMILCKKNLGIYILSTIGWYTLLTNITI